jgi:hypothetical protein
MQAEFSSEILKGLGGGGAQIKKLKNQVTFRSQSMTNRQRGKMAVREWSYVVFLMYMYVCYLSVLSVSPSIGAHSCSPTVMYSKPVFRIFLREHGNLKEPLTFICQWKSVDRISLTFMNRLYRSWPHPASLTLVEGRSSFVMFNRN